MKLLIDGGIVFTGPIAIMALVLIALAIRGRALLMNAQSTVQLIKWIHGLGLFAFVFGILGQLLGLIGALQMIAAAGSVSSAVLIGGLKISSISTVLGLFVFIESRLAILYLRHLQKKQSVAN